MWPLVSNVNDESWAIHISFRGTDAPRAPDLWRFSTEKVSPSDGTLFTRFERRRRRKQKLLQLMKSINARSAAMVLCVCVAKRRMHTRIITEKGVALSAMLYRLFTGQLKLCGVTLNALHLHASLVPAEQTFRALEKQPSETFTSHSLQLHFVGSWIIVRAMLCVACWALPFLIWRISILKCTSLIRTRAPAPVHAHTDTLLRLELLWICVSFEMIFGVP